MAFANDFKKAHYAYMLNKDVIENSFNGKLFNIELESNKFGELFDKYASTDILLKTNNNLIYGIALRVNFNKHWHNCITIRYKRSSGAKTEYEKTIESIQAKAINSYLGIQFDVDENNLIKTGVIYNRYDLFNYLNNNLDHYLVHNSHQVKEDGNIMLYIDYNYLKNIDIRHKFIT